MFRMYNPVCLHASEETAGCAIETRGRTYNGSLSILCTLREKEGTYPAFFGDDSFGW